MAYDGEVKNYLAPPAPLEVLPEHVVREARRLLTDPDHWTRCELAEDEEGETADPCSNAAVSFCLLGAVQRASSNLGIPGGTQIEDVVKEIAKVILDGDLDGYDYQEVVWEWNDHDADHADVLQVLDKCFTQS